MAGDRVFVDQRVELGDRGRVEHDVGGAGVLDHPVHVLGARDRHEVVALREQPRERELRQGAMVSRRDLAKRDQQRLVSGKIFRLEARPRDGCSDVVFSDVGYVAAPAGEELPRQRRERYERDAKLGAACENLLLGRARPQRVLGLHRGDRMHRVRAAQAVGADLGQADGADLALFDQARQRADAFLDRHVGIDAVQVVKVDDVGLQLAQAQLAGLSQHLGTAVARDLAGRILGDAALAGKHVLVASIRQVLANQALVMPATVHRRGIKETVAVVECRVEQFAGLVVVRPRTVTHGDVHAAEADRGNGEWSDLTLLHANSRV